MDLDKRNEFLINLFGFQKSCKMIYRYSLEDIVSIFEEMSNENYCIYLTTTPTFFSSKTIITVSLNGEIYSNRLYLRNNIAYGEVLEKSLERIVYLIKEKYYF